MEKVRFALAIIVGKIIFFLTRILGRGGGTAAPGLIANKIYPSLISRIASQLKYGSIIITGTNGKTTTSRILSSILRQAGYTPIHNRTGSNLMRGIASTLIEKCALGGKIAADIGLWEIDEAVFPHGLESIKPKTIIITNLFRDQLDRYGEIDKIARIWKAALVKLPKKTKVVLCGDDPLVANLGSVLKNQILYFGINDKSFALKKLPHTADSKQCPKCNCFLSFSSCFFSHLGHYHCQECGLCRPPIDIVCRKILFKETGITQISLNAFTKRLDLKIRLPGVYNIYNLLAAVAVAKILKISNEKIKKGVFRFKPAFGRVEKISVGKKEILIFLCKNPAGFNEVLRTITREKGELNLLIAINDLIADGRDISWLWDVDFDLLKNKVKNLTVSGTRAEDMILRLKYANIKYHLPAIATRQHLRSCGGLQAGISNINLEKDFQKAIKLSLQKTNDGEVLYILPTYTAMLEIRKVLSKMDLIHKSWED